MRSPLKRTSPSEGRKKEEMSLNSVDLPAPLGPITESISFSLTEKETLLTAMRPPKRLVSPEISRRSGMAHNRLRKTGPRLSTPLGRNSMRMIIKVE